MSKKLVTPEDENRLGFHGNFFNIGQPYQDAAMKKAKSFRIAVFSLVFGFIAALSLAQQAPKDLPDVDAELGSGAKLVVTAVSGPRFGAKLKGHMILGQRGEDFTHSFIGSELMF
jgi:hypothetical protein